MLQLTRKADCGLCLVLELAPRLAQPTADCPLVTVVGGQLIAQRQIDPALSERDEEFRRPAP